FPYTTLFRSTYSRSQELILSQTVLPDDHSEREPPDPIPNSDVKPLSADGSVGPPHVRVGHRQASIPKPQRNPPGLFSWRRKKSKARTPGGGVDLGVRPNGSRSGLCFPLHRRALKALEGVCNRKADTGGCPYKTPRGQAGSHAGCAALFSAQESGSDHPARQVKGMGS